MGKILYWNLFGKSKAETFCKARFANTGNFSEGKVSVGNINETLVSGLLFHKLKVLSKEMWKKVGQEMMGFPRILALNMSYIAVFLN